MRTPVTVKIKFKCSTIDQFAERYAADVSDAGIFIRTPRPLATGTHISFEFQYQDGSPLLSGNGTVVWVREHNPASAAAKPGMGVRFDQLPPESRAMLQQVVARKERSDAFQQTPIRVSNTSQDALHAIDLPTPAVMMPWAAAAQEPEFETLPTSQVGSSSAALRDAYGLGPSGALPPLTPSAGPRERAPEQPPQPFQPFQPFGSDVDLLSSAAEQGESAPPSVPAAAPSVPSVAPALGFGSDAAAPPRELGDLLSSSSSASPNGDLAPGRQERLEDIVFGDQEAPARQDAHSGAGPLVEEPVAASFAPRGAGARRATRRKTPGWLVPGLLIGFAVAGVLAFYALRPPPGATVGGEGEPLGSSVASSGTATPAQEPSATPSPTPAAGVSMGVESTPAGARVLVDGSDTGKLTPAELTELDPEREIEIALDLRGKKLFRTKQKPTPRLPLTVDLSASALRSIQILSTPPGATVFLDGVRIGDTATLHALAPGAPDKTVELRLSKRGFTDVTNRIDLATANWERDGENEVLKVDLVLSAKDETAATAAARSEPSTRVERTARPAPAGKTPSGSASRGVRDPGRQPVGAGRPRAASRRTPGSTPCPAARRRGPKGARHPHPLLGRVAQPGQLDAQLDAKRPPGHTASGLSAKQYPRHIIPA
ncbi:MAG: TIGR02266 family protein [Proteobacteria bacterium]|nr:TIGR02266 family protein [Pseudomonadota bacterium]